MGRIEFIQKRMREEIENTINNLEERLSAMDWAGALKKESELNGLMTAWQIVCTGESFDNK